MAIHSTEKLGQTSTKSSCSKSSNKSSRRVVNYTADESNSSFDSKYDAFKKKKKVSPYLAEGRIEMLSRITEKRLVRNETGDFYSSYPLAVNIYKASSDEFRALKKSKKVKKSVLTLPNEPAPLPQPCTVSDMNESEYFDDVKDEKKLKQKKMRIIQNNRKPRTTKVMEVFNRDAEYCSRLNIDLDRSSTDVTHQFTGDGKRVSSKRRNNKSKKSNVKPHNVWAMLRDMNRFPFKASPAVSDESLASIKKNAYNKRLNNLDTKFIETHTTEEFTYFSNLVDKSTHSQSSIDRITVIDKQNEYREFHEELKVFRNKFPSKVKTQKNTKKVKAIARGRQTSLKAVGDEKKNEKQNFQKDVIPKMRNELSNSFNSFQNNMQSRCNSPNSVCTNNCFYCRNNISEEDKEFNTSDGLINLCGNSDSSNADIIKNDTCNKMSSCDSQVPIKGITKVVLSKGENILLTEKADSPPKTNLRITKAKIPNAAPHPKLTVTDIRRRLANIKFPLVILGKDQLTSAPFPVTNYEPPHFAALSQHIWPFMQNWHKNVDKSISNSSKRVDAVSKSTPGMKGCCVLENNNANGTNDLRKSTALKNKNTAQLALVTHTENDTKALKTKPIQEIKARILQFLHKKSSDVDSKKYTTQERPKRKECYNHVDVATNTHRDLMVPVDRDKITSQREDKMPKCTSSNKNHTYPKGRRVTSDFIDNVIKKIRRGIYYSQDEKEPSRGYIGITKEDSVQAEVIPFQNEFCINCIQKTDPVFEDSKCIKCDTVPTIPGFDDSLLDLQIETINRDTIAVKHCVTNIIVQFDVTMLSEINRVPHLAHSVSCIPIPVTGSNTKIFKAPTTIVNAILPAEICSILPNTMKNIIGSKLFQSKIDDKVESHLSPIVELTPFESGDSIKHLIPVHISGSPELRICRQGNFVNNKSKITTKTILSDINRLRSHSFEEFYSPKMSVSLPKIGRNLLDTCQIDPFALHIFAKNHSRPYVPENRLLQPKTNSMALQPYSSANKQLVPAFTFNVIIDLIVAILSNPVFTIQISTPQKNSLNDLYSNNSIHIITMEVDGEENKGRHVISDVLTDPFYNNLQNKKALPKISKLYPKKQKQLTNENRNKKKSYVKLYRKCKSMSSISNERSSIPLSKIMNLEDFFLTLGSAKSLASIFDGNTERKILTSIKEMKNWMSDITPRQAMLVLLLANKKDTSNLVRYRPVLLQGIAVKRITRASELDMEIEVIERENLNTFSQYEGFSYLPAIAENQDSLLEELCWIAKTTASDYQKPFDESSERLLKSLLEKRKKLNPSYLRVMARYVGLGLLKSPKSN